MTGLSCSSWQQEERWCKSDEETEGREDDLTMRLWHIKDKPCFYTYRQEQEVPPLTSQPLELSSVLAASLRKKREKWILELILVIVLQIYIFFVSSVLRNRTFPEHCRPRMNHVWKTWHFFSNTQKGKNVGIVWKPVPLSSPTEQQPTTQITKKNNLQFSSRWRAQRLLICVHLTVAFCEHN